MNLWGITTGNERERNSEEKKEEPTILNSEKHRKRKRKINPEKEEMISSDSENSISWKESPRKKTKINEMPAPTMSETTESGNVKELSGTYQKSKIEKFSEFLIF